VSLAQREPPEARAEFRAGATCYDDSATGQDVPDATRQSRESIAAMPDAWPPFSPMVRRKDEAGFP